MNKLLILLLLSLLFIACDNSNSGKNCPEQELCKEDGEFICSDKKVSKCILDTNACLLQVEIKSCNACNTDNNDCANPNEYKCEKDNLLECSCISKDNCPDNYSCVSNRCIKDVSSCNSDSECKNGFQCRKCLGNDCPEGVEKLCMHRGRECKKNSNCQSRVARCNKDGKNVCICDYGYCIDICEPNPCKNDGICSVENDDYVCECPAGFSGKNCEININDCEPNPCKNGGNCIDGINSYTCECPAGYTGDNCETKLKSCEPNPCKNGGNCSTDGNIITCTCPDGYKGSLCEINIDECNPNPCKNGGNCIDAINSYTCECPVGYTGDNCEKCANNYHEENNKCELNNKTVECKQEGKPTHSSYTVEEVEITWNGNSWSEPQNCTWNCTDGFHGDNCDLAQGECPEGYFGDNCDKRKFWCKISPDKINSDPFTAQSVLDEFDGRVYLTIKAKSIITTQELQNYVNNMKFIIGNEGYDYSDYIVGPYKVGDGVFKYYLDFDTYYKNTCGAGNYIYAHLACNEYHNSGEPYKYRYEFDLQDYTGRMKCDYDGNDNNPNTNETENIYYVNKQGEMKIAYGNCPNDGNIINPRVFGRCEQGIGRLTQEHCNPGSFEGHSYSFCQISGKNWTQAKEECSKMNKKLLKINNSRENRWIRDNIRSPYNNEQYTYYWLALNDRENEAGTDKNSQNWKWGEYIPDSSNLDLSIGGYNNWGPQRPKASNEHNDCVIISNSTSGNASDYRSGEWLDIDCSDTDVYFICESE